MPEPLKQFLIQEIEKNGAISLGAFMAHALSHPLFGYYMTRDPFGVDGDFTTAPEISQLFGEMIGAWVVDIWTQAGQPEFDLIEFGPGRGTLMLDILRVAQAAPEFLDKARIRLLECSPVLRKIQEKVLQDFNVEWHNDLSTISGDRFCLMLGNEFLDALPIEQLKRSTEGWQQRFVDVKAGALVFVWNAADEELVGMLPNKTESLEIYEVSPARCSFVQECAARVKNGGAALFIDYGHIKSHHGDTLQAVQRHKFVNVLETVGQADLTAHVDFEALLRRLDKVYLKSVIPQGKFLQNLGIDYRLNALKSKDLVAGYKRLVRSDQMGDLFKVLCFYKGDFVPAGFD
ncbi:MAG: SAM-dependent methyltransferase [Alphaproteobacteria bacterium]|nr:SAM-dependent methyltransferase [Alphaproteobacteria bacterium]